MSLRIKLGREVELWNGAERIPLRTRHERGILANLALNASLPVSRTRLAQDHWPDAARGAALLNLRQRLLWLKRALNGAVDSDRDWVWLNTSLVQVEIVDEQGERLQDLSFPGVERYRNGYFMQSEPVQTASSASPIRILDIQKWMWNWVFEGETISQPFAGRLEELKRRSLKSSRDSEEFALLTVAAASEAMRDPESVFAEQCGVELLSHLASDPRFYPAAAMLGELAANNAHRRGEYHLCLAFIAESERVYQLLKAIPNALRMRFKYYRVSLDLGLTSAGERALSELHEKHRKRLTPHAAALLDDNLIFAHANIGNLDAAREALIRARARNDGSSLVEENAAVLHLEAGELREAAACLVRSNATTFDPTNFANSALLWQRSVELLSASGRIEGCALAQSLLNINFESTGRAITVTNRLRLNRSINRALSTYSGAKWIEATRIADQLDAFEKHGRVLDELRWTAANA